MGKLSISLLWITILTAMLAFGALALQRHDAFLTNGYDLGNVDQALWNTAQGRILAFTNMAPLQNRLALHVEPVLFFFVPFYMLGAGPQVLLVAQAVIVALGALPVFWLARERLGSDYAGLVFSAAYLLFPALEAGLVSDFHAVTLAAPLLLFALHALERRQMGRFWLFGLLAVSCKEEIGLVWGALGLYLLITRRDVRHGLGAALSGLGWFALALLVIQPTFSGAGGNIHLGRYAWLGDGLPEIALALVTRPGLVWHHLWAEAEVAGYLWRLLLPLALLPLAAPGLLLVAVPSLAANLLSSDPFMWRAEEFHYAAPVVPFAVVAAINGLKRLAGLAERALPASRPVGVLCTLLLAVSLVYHHYRGYSPLARPFYWPEVTPHHALAESVIGQIPGDAALLAQINLNPHVSHRQVLYQDFAWLDSADEVLLDVSSLANKDDVHRYIQDRLLAGGDFGPVAAQDGYLLLRRGAPQEPLPEEFYTFAWASDDEIQYQVTADFGDALRLVGFSLTFYREEEVVPVLYWQALRPLERDYRLNLYLLDEDGVPIGATRYEQPVTVWLPTGRWPVGKTVRVAMNTLPWYTRDREQYGLAVGVTEGTDPWAVEARLPPHSAQSALAPWLAGGGTLLKITDIGKVAGMPEARLARRSFHTTDVDGYLAANVGGQVELSGYRWGELREAQGLGRRLDCASYPAPCSPWGPDRSLRFVLYWRALRRVDVSYTVFTHLVGEDGRVVAQRDGLPGGSRLPPERGAAATLYPTDFWREGEVVADPYVIAVGAEVPPGRYRLLAGMYRSDSGARLPVLDEGGQTVADSVVVAEVQLP
jgi:uncharacterized membrane protein